MSLPLRQAICSEIFQGWKLADACRAARKAGYEGFEIAPFTLAEDPAALTPAERRECRDIITSEGLEYAGIHWLMVSPKGLHVTTPDNSLRERSWRHIHNLIDLSADLGGGVMVFGSPQQRAATGGSTREDATRRFVEGLAEAAPHAADRGVVILIEALPKAQCDVVQTLEEAVALMHEINSPAVRTMFDTHNAVDQAEPHAVLVDRYYDFIRHVHLNELDGRHCGAGDYDFQPLLETLLRRGYRRWVSLEAFDFTPGAETIANDSLRHLERVMARIRI